MNYTVIVIKEAIDDAQDAYNYYESKSLGLGERFLQSLEDTFHSLSLYPTNFGFIDNKNTLRDKLIDIFPFVVIV